MKTEIVAHRGITHLAPENTLPALHYAWKRNISVEIDVRLTKDKKIVAFHDSHTKRLLGTKWHVNKIPLKTLISRKIVFSDQNISPLAEILKKLPKGPRLFIEIKCGNEIIPLLKECLLDVACNKLNQIAIISFNLNTLAKCIDEEIKTKFYWTGAKVRNPKLVPIDGFLCRYVSEESINIAHEQGYEIYAWTVNSYNEAYRLINLGVNGIVTDRALQIMEFLKKRINLE